MLDVQFGTFALLVICDNTPLVTAILLHWIHIRGKKFVYFLGILYIM